MEAHPLLLAFLQEHRLGTALDAFLKFGVEAEDDLWELDAAGPSISGGAAPVLCGAAPVNSGAAAFFLSFVRRCC
eukprot:3937557-Rhodomonas_salina.1